MSNLWIPGFILSKTYQNLDLYSFSILPHECLSNPPAIHSDLDGQFSSGALPLRVRFKQPRVAGTKALTVGTGRAILREDILVDHVWHPRKHGEKTRFQREQKGVCIFS